LRLLLEVGLKIEEKLSWVLRKCAQEGMPDAGKQVPTEHKFNGGGNWIYIGKLIVNKYFQLLLLSQQNQSILQPQTRKPTQMHLILQYIEVEDFS